MLGIFKTRSTSQSVCLDSWWRYWRPLTRRRKQRGPSGWQWKVWSLICRIPMNSDTAKFYQTSGVHSRSTRMNFQPKATETDSSNRAKQSSKRTVVGLFGGGRGIPKTNDSLCKIVAHIFLKCIRSCRVTLNIILAQRLTTITAHQLRAKVIKDFLFLHGSLPSIEESQTAFQRGKGNSRGEEVTR